MNKKRSNALMLFFGGILPLVGYGIIEDQYGPLWGTVAGMVLGVGEIIFEYYRYKTVSKLTWGSNALILIMGAISIFTNEGLWFKLQPTLLELVFAFLLWGSVLMKKNLFLAMAEKQGTQIPDIVKPRMNGLCLRLGVFMCVHAALNVWAALYWSTAAWIFLKGIGLTVSMILYMIIEAVFLRKAIQKKEQP